jgi:hypothetical protein
LKRSAHRRVITDEFEPGANSDIEHIALASTIDLLLIAPATANIIGKLANGIADDFLSTLYVATRAPVLVAPSMNTQMFAHDAVRRNLDALVAHGVKFVEPGEGYLACGWIEKGRLAEPTTSSPRPSPCRSRRVARGQRVWGPPGRRGRRSVTISNRSSAGWGLRSPPGRRVGCQVTLVAGPRRSAAGGLDRARSKRRRHARAVMARADRMHRRHGGGRGRLHPERRAARKLRSATIRSRLCSRRPRHPGELAGAGCDRQRTPLVGSRRKLNGWRAPPPTRAETRRSHCRQRRRGPMRDSTSTPTLSRHGQMARSRFHCKARRVSPRRSYRVGALGPREIVRGSHDHAYAEAQKGYLGRWVGWAVN